MGAVLPGIAPKVSAPAEGDPSLRGGHPHRNGNTVLEGRVKYDVSSIIKRPKIDSATGAMGGISRERPPPNDRLTLLGSIAPARADDEAQIWQGRLSIHDDPRENRVDCPQIGAMIGDRV